MIDEVKDKDRERESDEDAQDKQPRPTHMYCTRVERKTLGMIICVSKIIIINNKVTGIASVILSYAILYTATLHVCVTSYPACFPPKTCPPT
jgi:hypothetical protein